MRLFSYIVTQDTGFAPNPFWGYCTLATCKPVICRTASSGDWIVGLTPKENGHKVVYFMQVQEVLPIAEYFRNQRFSRKKPDYTTQAVIDKCGDNIYQPLSNGGFRQLRSQHSNGTEENLAKKAHDLSGVNVLISQRFVYFGSEARQLTAEFDGIKAGHGHRCRFPDALVAGFLRFAAQFKSGVRAAPSKWPSGDLSWRQGSA